MSSKSNSQSNRRVRNTSGDGIVTTTTSQMDNIPSNDDDNHDRESSSTSITTPQNLVTKRNPRWNSFLSSLTPPKSHDSGRASTTSKSTPTSSTFGDRRGRKLLSSIRTSTTTSIGNNRLDNPLVSTAIDSNWTIDDALRTLYDENIHATFNYNDDPHPDCHRRVEHDSNNSLFSSSWWNIDPENYYYKITKKERKFIKSISSSGSGSNNVPMDDSVDIDDNETNIIQVNDDDDDDDDDNGDTNVDEGNVDEVTLQLFQELHTDPILSIMEYLENKSIDIDNKNVDQTKDTEGVDDRYHDNIDDDDDDDDAFGDFQSATDAEIPSQSTTTEIYIEENIGTEQQNEREIGLNNETINTPDATVRHDGASQFNDVDDDEAMLQYVDTVCAGIHALTDSDTTSTSPNASSSIDTPDLVRIVDDIIDAATNTLTTSANEETDDQVESVIDSVCQDLSSTQFVHEEMVLSSTTNEQSDDADKNPVESFPPPLSLLLPVGDDLSTLESRFIRRLQQQYKLEHGENVVQSDKIITSTPIVKTTYPDLPPYYFTNPDLDDTISVLQSLPWEYVVPSSTRGVGSFDIHDKSFDRIDSWTLWDEYITSRLCQLDTALEQIQSDTLIQIRPYKERINQANKLIHEFDQNLRLSFMYCERSQHSFQSLMGLEDENVGLTGPTVLLQAFDRRDECHSIGIILDQVNDVLIKERNLINRIDRFNVKEGNALEEYYDVMKLAKNLEQLVSNTNLAQLHCLQMLRDRLASIGLRFWNRLIDIARIFVVQSCREKADIDWNSYERLLRAVLDLKAQSAIDKFLGDIDFPSSWIDNVTNVLSYEADRALVSALLKPTRLEDSLHLVELNQLSCEVDSVWGDYGLLRDVSDSAVTVRFDLEWQLHYLPRVFHRLCTLLTNILLSHHAFNTWHEAAICKDIPRMSKVQNVATTESLSEQSDLVSIHESIRAYTTELWEHCESIIAQCVDEYLNVAPRRPLFKRIEDSTVDTLWREDLERLHNVYCLANVFLSMKRSFYELNNVSPSNVGDIQDSILTKKLSNLFRRHLRVVHVEAMNTLGRCLANESWILGSFMVTSEPERTDQPELSIEAILLRALLRASRRSESMSDGCIKSLCILSSSYDSRSLTCRLKASKNPFEACASSISNAAISNSKDSLIPNEVEHSEHIVYRTLCSFIHESDGSIRLAPDSVSKELVSWFGRLLLVMENLSLIADDVCAVFTNLCDLYLTTVFRLCSGNAKNESLILGEALPNPIHFHSQESSKSNEKIASPPMFGSFRNTPKKTTTKQISWKPSPLSPNLDAEICYPRPRYLEQVSMLQKFINRAQTSLRDVVSLDMIDSWLVDPNTDSPEEQGCEVARVLIKREGSISSCYSVAALIEVTQKIARQNQSSLLPQEFAIDKQLTSFQSYSQTVLDVIPIFVQVARQMACTRAVSGSSVVKDILKVDSGWEECKLHECCNDYIDDLCYRCSLIWGYVAASTKLPLIIMRETWECIVSVSYLSLLDGFSRIRQCSTEGRALMALDLASFKAGLSPTNIAERLEGIVPANKPPPINPEINFFYVETYIKVYYYPKDDVFNWIKDNCDQYTLNHVIGLAISVLLSNQQQNSHETWSDVISNIKALYHLEDEKEAVVVRHV